MPSLRPYSRSRRVSVPNVSTKTTNPMPINYEKGLVTGVPNDEQPENTLRYVVDKRFDGVGKYKTRKGCDPYSVPIGQTINVQVNSTIGASNAGFTTTTWIAEKVTATTTGVLTRVDTNLKNSDGATGTIMTAVYSDVAGSPGVLLGRSSIADSSVATTYAYETGYFIKAPSITNGTSYWVVTYLQDSGQGTMYVSSTTNTTNAKISTNAGQSWSSASYSLNVKLYTSTAGGVKGLTRIYRPDGTPVTFFAHGTDIYKVDDSNGNTTSIDNGINAGATDVIFEYVNDTLYYVDQMSKPRKYDFSSSSQVATAPGNAFDIIEHVGILFFLDADDPTKMWYSNFADYETFTSTDFIYVPAPKKADRAVAFAKLNGVLYIITQANKYTLMGQDNATFQLDEAYGQKGTFSQKSVAWDANTIFLASNDGVYSFNGTYEKNIFESVIDDYVGITYKLDIHLQLFNNRLYVWFRPDGQAEVSACYVYNTLYNVMEAVDFNTEVGRSFARHDTSGLFLQASHRAGVVYYGEQDSNDYNNLGDALSAEVRTSYDHFGTPQQKKRITYWRPIIESTAGNYSLDAGFSADYSDDTTYRSVALQSTGFFYDDPGTLYDDATYATGGVTTDTTLNISGDAYRWQRRYRHYAAREPIVFAGEVLTVQTQRLR